eukprot:TRINITY_DN21636_c0_g1_i1.p1 TRINITY_DN21636_c0_g1~~TRINITY_DN21636_c0_g1_i1.p1  ORF type:complete len:602 (+),score=61.13 TRINITY_DN21636_c0_g1_i1:258-1808(+)
MDMLCAYMPIVLEEPCRSLINEFGARVIEILENEGTPDLVCQEIELCTNKTCSLFPPPSSPTWKNKPDLTKSDITKFFPKPRLQKKSLESRNIPRGWTPWDWIYDQIKRVFGTHEPLIDLDGDFFSTYQELRGTYWRGGDCDDLESTIYPGRQQTNFDPLVDHDCNGISGSATNGTSWEELYCSSTKRMGIAIMGDSAGAHFHVPPSYVQATILNGTTFDDLIEILEMEFDWPQMSATTGFLHSDWRGHPEGPMKSMYSNFVERNLCNHRDFQSIAVNGARSSSMLDIMKTYARNKTLDHPTVLSYALIGNDVCNPHPGIGHMTTPAEFYANVMKALDYFETILPMGSYVTFTGLCDGRILYDTMHARIHPIGEPRKDVTYANLYDFLECLGIAPCWGWMNKDSYWRNATTERAFLLNDQYKRIVKEVNGNHTYKNFNVTYFDCPLHPVVEHWNKIGGQTWQLIEPVDGFHPSQIANELFVSYSWDKWAKEAPYLIPQKNHFNAEIKKRFGDQGGY